MGDRRFVGRQLAVVENVSRLFGYIFLLAFGQVQHAIGQHFVQLVVQRVRRQGMHVSREMGAGFPFALVANGRHG